jgi:hypothetical protein
MEYGNTAVVLTVIAVVACVLAIVGIAVWRLNKTVDQDSR